MNNKKLIFKPQRDHDPNILHETLLRQGSFYVLAFLLVSAFSLNDVRAQGLSRDSVLKLEDAYRLALTNSYQLKISDKNKADARQQVEIVKDARLPQIGTDLAFGYISSADSWNPSFGDHSVSPIPHQFTAFSVQASQLIFKGGEVKNTIKKSVLREEIASLSNEKNQEDIKLLVAAKYLDIFRLVSQRKIYENNIRLTKNRLQNVLTMQKQGMVTQNDVLRTQLTISDLELALRRNNNDMTILNSQLNLVTGRPDTAVLFPDSLLLQNRHELRMMTEYQQQAAISNQDLKISGINNKIAANEIALLESERLPQIFLYTRTNLQRPFTGVVPAVDIYSNVWQAGIGLHYNLSSTYTTSKKIESGRIELAAAQDRETLEKQNLYSNVKAAFIKFKEAGEDLQTLTSDLQSAEENYRVVEKKYFNQLALLTDMIDATNTKIESELKVTNARINLEYTYCQLLYQTGTL
ncbi:TolC family protein [Mucilaginibacter sp. 22184]|uniref:TolC family protein n=1 Tax=Mucilaginibacter sp. 22184 TaxID=3453887 RepID=UPI003F86AC0E